MAFKYKYAGPSRLTRGDYGERIDYIYKLAWGIDCSSCEHYNPNDAVCSHECVQEHHFYPSEDGHTWGVWDSTFGFLAWPELGQWAVEPVEEEK